jgi:geranyl-CoA carboxylase alpha subunit
LRVLAIGDHEARIELAGAEERVPFVVAEGIMHLARRGASFSFKDNSHTPAARHGAALGDGRLVAPMNGRVAAVHAKPGETIATGQALVVLEAMKMEHGLALPAPVRVTSVHVAAGAQVAPGHLLLEFVPA